MPDESVIKKMIQQAAAAAQTPLGREGERDTDTERGREREGER